MAHDQPAGSPIRTPDQRLRVFVSSTLAELADERAAVARAVNALRLTPVMFELGARPYPPQELYRAYLAQSDIFVGLYWQRYGWVGPGMDISGLEDEFNLSGGMPRLLYVKTPAPDREPGLTALIERVQTEATDSYRSFRTARELSRLVRDDLAVLLSERFAASDSSVPHTNTATLASPRRALPVATTPLVGRDDAIDEVVKLLTDPNVRLVTLTGPGGIGKTRLAVAVAERLETRFSSAVTFVPLASVIERDLVVPRIAAALGVPVEGTRSALDAMAEHLGDAPILLVLDNLEQVVAVAPQLDQLLAACPGMKILATSRAVLRVQVEHEYPVAPLDVPAAWEGLTLEELSNLPAVELFVSRARSVRQDFVLSAANAPAVVEICRRLDGLPLAIELAAARIRLLDAAALLARLGRNLDALGTGPVNLPERQRTLRATVEWSVDLLDDSQRELLTALGVFVDGWTLEAATACAHHAEDEVLDLLDALVGHSLVQVVGSDAGPRMRMLEAVRTYAAELLAASPVRDEVKRRHAEFFRDFLDEMTWPKDGDEQGEWSDRMDVEYGNVAAAIRWFLDHDITPLPHMFRLLWMYWQLNDRMPEGRRFVVELLPRAEEFAPHAQAELFLAAAVTAVETGDDAGALAAGQRIDALEGQIDEPYLRSAMRLVVSWIRLIEDDLDGAMRDAAMALDGFRRIGDAYMTASAYSTLWFSEMATGRNEAARQHLNEMLTIGQESGFVWFMALGWSQLATLAVEDGQLAEAHRFLQLAADAEPDAVMVTQVLTFCLVASARLRLAEGDARGAAVALGAAFGTRARAGLKVWPTSRRSEDELQRRVEQALDPEEFRAASAEGGAIPRHAALALVTARPLPRRR